MNTERGFWGRIFCLFFCFVFWRSETDLDQKSLESRDCLGSCGLTKMDQIYGVKMPHTGCDVCFWAGFNCLDIMSQKSGWKIRFGQYVTNGRWMNSLSIFLWMIWAVLGWTNTPSTFMFAWDVVLQWMLCTWVAKYSELYMRVEVSLGQGVHGLFIKCH